MRSQIARPATVSAAYQRRAGTFAAKQPECLLAARNGHLPPVTYEQKRPQSPPCAHPGSASSAAARSGSLAAGHVKRRASSASPDLVDAAEGGLRLARDKMRADAVRGDGVRLPH